MQKLLSAVFFVLLLQFVIFSGIIISANKSRGSTAQVRTCLHKKYVWIFEHNFVADKAKIRRRALARQVFFTQYAAKFAEKTRVYACEARF